MIRKVKNLVFLTGLLFGVGFLFSLENKEAGSYSPYKILDNDLATMSVEEALISLGDDKPKHYIPKADPDSVRMGEELIKFGRLKDKSNSRVSKYFVCTDCHNLQLETDDPSDESPERVLNYSMEKDIPFLPGSTFYGMYNKRHWYNGDYAKKYGALVAPCRDTLENAIQLCATQCSQGREMEPWEIRCVMHYYKSIELKVTDLNFDEAEKLAFFSIADTKKEKAREVIHSKYNEINDAHFGDSKIPKIEGYKPVFKNGEFIYENGCLHCHAVGRNITNFDLGVDKLSFRFLAAKKEKYNSFSISHITRYGTYAISGRKQYMPQYTFENMSDEQMLDLMFYIENKAKE